MTCRPVVALIVAFAVSPVWAADKPTKEEAHKYLQAIETANKRLFDAGQAWAAKAGFLHEEPTDLPALQSEFQKLVKVVDQVTAEMKALKPPAGKSAEALAAAHQRFLDFQRGTVQKALKPVMAIAEDRSLTDADRLKKALEIIDREYAGEQELTAQLQKAQKAFIEEHGLIPPDLRP